MHERLNKKMLNAATQRLKRRLRKLEVFNESPHVNINTLNSIKKGLEDVRAGRLSKVKWTTSPGTVNVYDGKAALKFDKDKPDLSQVSRELMEGLARVRSFGEKKYSRDNWRKGFKITRSLSAALRHIVKFNSGENLDDESGLNHLFHAVACLEHAIWDFIYHPKNDDRYKR